MTKPIILENLSMPEPSRESRVCTTPDKKTAIVFYETCRVSLSADSDELRTYKPDFKFSPTHRKILLPFWYGQILSTYQDCFEFRLFRINPPGIIIPYENVRGLLVRLAQGKRDFFLW